MADLPASLAGAVDPGRGELVVRTTEVIAVLAALAGWAGAHGLDLAGLEVGAPASRTPTWCSSPSRSPPQPPRRSDPWLSPPPTSPMPAAWSPPARPGASSAGARPPLPRWGYLAGRFCATVLLALASGAVTVLVGVLVYHARLSAGAALGLVVALGLAARLGLCRHRAHPVDSDGRVRPAVAGLQLLPVMLLSGALGGLGGTPSWVADLLGYLPGRATVEAATRALRATGGLPVLAGHDLAVLGAWAVAGLLASVRLFRWEPQPPRAPRPARP